MKNKITILSLLALLLLTVFTSCKPEAKWETKDVEVSMQIKNVSAGFVECDFSTNKDAYYLISICKPWPDYNPVYNSKQFMQLALDSVYAEYLFWRYDLLRDKEFNVAPFSSHSLQYGHVNHFFTGLLPDSDYWVFAFPVDPVEIKPAGPLNLVNVTTKHESNMDIHFEYRVKGDWDYAYPVDTTGKIYEHFPYIATTCDSAKLAQDSIVSIDEVCLYFIIWAYDKFSNPETADPKFGVYAVKNDGYQSAEAFKVGHTYYTAFSGFDGSFKQLTIYRFKWTGANCDYYFYDTDSANIINSTILFDNE